MVNYLSTTQMGIYLLSSHEVTYLYSIIYIPFDILAYGTYLHK
jgi:hypothetical protein